MTTVTELVDRAEHADALDRVARPLRSMVGRLVRRPRPVRKLLSGTWVGHPLHPMLSDLPIGARCSPRPTCPRAHLDGSTGAESTAAGSARRGCTAGKASSATA